MSKRTEKVASSLQRAISSIIQYDIKDPRVGMVTITKVKVSRDLKHAVVYASLFGKSDEVSASLKILRKSLGYIKSRINKYIKLRFTPEIELVHDETEITAQRVETIIKEMHQEDDPTDPYSES